VDFDQASLALKKFIAIPTAADITPDMVIDSDGSWAVEVWGLSYEGEPYLAAEMYDGCVGDVIKSHRVYCPTYRVRYYG
jgi:hypothetical protein